jgi:hypothetical protein
MEGGYFANLNSYRHAWNWLQFGSTDRIIFQCAYTCFPNIIVACSMVTGWAAILFSSLERNSEELISGNNLLNGLL